MFHYSQLRSFAKLKLLTTGKLLENSKEKKKKKQPIVLIRNIAVNSVSGTQIWKKRIHNTAFLQGFLLFIAVKQDGNNLQYSKCK